MISIDLDLMNKRKITKIDYIGKITFPSEYFAHLLKGLNYTTFLPFIRLKPNRLLFIYWQQYSDGVLNIEYLTELRERLVHKYYAGDSMVVTDYQINEFKGKEAHFLYGSWENSNDKLRGIFELMALEHDGLLICIDLSTTEKGRDNEAIKELRRIRDNFELIEYDKQ